MADYAAEQGKAGGGKPREDTALLKTARDRLKRATEAEDIQRRSILEAKKFRSLDQWPEEIRIQRQGGNAVQGIAAQPPRPCLTIDRISAPTRNVSNMVKAANFAINVLPNGHGADDDTAKIFKGLLRKAQNDSRAQAPFEWAADGAAEGGIGWFRLRSDYCDDDGFDQDLKFERITNNLSVYCDPSAVLPTRADALWMFVTEDVPKDEFEQRYPKASVPTQDDFRAIGDDSGWITEDSIRIAEYWRIEFENERLVELVTGQTFRGESIPEDLPKEAVKRERSVKVPKVRCAKMTAVEVLDDWEWVGSHIPLFPILGEELNVDGKVVLRGVIASAMDAQRMVNYMYSGAIETVSLAPKSPLIIAEGQVEGYEALWQNANRFNYSYLPYRPVSLAGTPVPPPQRQTAEAPIQAMVLMLEKSEEAIKSTTGVYDPSLGNTNPREKSGRAILALQKQTDLGHSNYLDNTANALIYAGECFVEAAPKIYDRPGRIVQISGINDEPEHVMLGQPYQSGQDGQPQAVSVSPEMVKAQKGLAKFYDLTAGKYAVTVSVGKSYTTKREEGVAVLGELIGNNPSLLSIVGDIFFRDLDTPGAQEISERMKKMLPPQVMEQGAQPSPEQLQAKIQQASKMIEALTQELNAKNMLIETDGVKNQAQLQQKQVQEAAENTRTLASIESAERIAKWKIAADLIKTDATINADRASQLIEAEMGELDRRAMLVAGDADRSHKGDEGEANRRQAIDMARESAQNAETTA